jgi:hypothetical protein
MLDPQLWMGVHFLMFLFASTEFFLRATMLLQDWQFVQLGEQQNFGIKTAGLEDKATACQMLVCYARFNLQNILIV